MEKVLLIGVNVNNDPDFDYHMEELEGLAEACEMEVVGTVTQNLPAVSSAWYVGSGKLEEIRLAADELGAETAVFDNSLKPFQLRNLEKALEIPVLDRTNLILDIFERRARTREARLQVESASLQYMLPRLSGRGSTMSRLGGAAGGGLTNRGAGETKLELDRRRIEKRISELNRELRELDQNRNTQRRMRQKSELPSVALVGYTNAGKSTLMNRMLETYMNEPEKLPREETDEAPGGKKVFEKDMLFATLDTTVRRINPGDHRDFLLSDTVGFIDGLPPTLVKAFRSTLAEAVSADLILQVVDFSDPHYKEQMQVTEDTLRELEAEQIPCIYVMNKSDLVMEETDLPNEIGDRIYMSAKKGFGLDLLVKRIQETLFCDYRECEMLIPYTDGAVSEYLREHTTVRSLEYVPEGVRMKLLCKESDIGRYGRYIV